MNDYIVIWQREDKGYLTQEPSDKDAGQFGEFDETGIGTDLTLEWDSTDPDLHLHPMSGVQQDEEDPTDPALYGTDAGIPDA